jgi:ABC-type transporter Mla maintaining outer membrane lipid asymmetry permease subunit MlaE
MYAGQHEATGKDSHGFAIFPSPMAGWRALIAQIALGQARGLTLDTFTAKYDKDANERTYLKRFMDELHVNADTLVAGISKYAVAGIIASEEGYFAA